jgi:hypothetical protein
MDGLEVKMTPYDDDSEEGEDLADELVITRNGTKIFSCIVNSEEVDGLAEYRPIDAEAPDDSFVDENVLMLPLEFKDVLAATEPVKSKIQECIAALVQQGLKEDEARLVVLKNILA